MRARGGPGGRAGGAKRTVRSCWAAVRAALGLGGALLGVAQFGDGLGEGGKPDDHDRPLTGTVSARCA